MGIIQNCNLWHIWFSHAQSHLLSVSQHLYKFQRHCSHADDWFLRDEDLGGLRVEGWGLRFEVWGLRFEGRFLHSHWWLYRLIFDAWTDHSLDRWRLGLKKTGRLLTLSLIVHSLSLHLTVDFFNNWASVLKQSKQKMASVIYIYIIFHKTIYSSLFSFVLATIFRQRSNCRNSYKEPLKEGTVPGSSSSVTFWLQLLLKVQAYVWRNAKVPAEGMAFPS